MLDDTPMSGIQDSDTQQNQTVYVSGVGIVSQDEITKSRLEEDVCGIYVGRDFGFKDLDILVRELATLRHENSLSEEELASHDEIIQKIDRKLRIREAFGGPCY